MRTPLTTSPAFMSSVHITLQPAACALSSTIASKNATLRVWCRSRPGRMTVGVTCTTSNCSKRSSRKVAAIDPGRTAACRGRHWPRRRPRHSIDKAARSHPSAHTLRRDRISSHRAWPRSLSSALRTATIADHGAHHRRVTPSNRTRLGSGSYPSFGRRLGHVVRLVHQLKP